MKKLLVFLLTAPLAAQTINPNQIRPSDHTGWVLTTPLASTPPVWAPLPSTATPAFNMVVNPPIAGQYAVVYPTGGVITRDPPGLSDIFANGIGSGGSFLWKCSGLLCSIAGDVEAHWTGFSLPSYINPANVTAIYADAITSSGPVNNFWWTDNFSGTSLTCNGAQTMLSQTSYPYAATEVSTLTGLTGATFNSTAECHIQVGGSGPGDHGQLVDVTAIRFLVFYTGTPPPVDTALHLAPPLGLNLATNTLFLDQTDNPAGHLLDRTIAMLPPPAASNGSLYFVYDGTSTSDCSTGGGAFRNGCWSNGSTYVSVFSSGGGGSSFITSLTTTGTSGAATVSSGVLNIPQYQGALTLTTTGTSGAATLIGNTLNIPQYSGGGGGGIGGSGTIGYLPKFVTNSTTLGNSHIDDGITTASTLTASEPIAVNDGTGAAGAVKLQQGTAATNGTNAVTLTVPSSVTSYRVQLPGVEPTSGNTYLSCTAADPAVCSWAAGGGGGSLPTATAAGQIIASTGAGTTYVVAPNVFYSQSTDTISSIETECGSTPCTYYVNQPFTYTLSGNHSLSKFVNLIFLANGKWTINGSGFALTIQTPVQGTEYDQHFAIGSGANINFSFGSLGGNTQTVWLEWLGAKADNSTDNVTMMQACATMHPYLCRAHDGVYLFSNTVTFGSTTSWSNIQPTGLQGAGAQGGAVNQTVFKFTGTIGTNAIVISGTSGTHYQGGIFQDFILNNAVNATAASNGISLTYVDNVIVNRLQVGDFQNGLYLKSFNRSAVGEIDNVSIGWGFANGTTGYTTQTLCGINLDTSSAVPSHSVYLNYDQAGTNSINGNPPNLSGAGICVSGTLNSDLFVNQFSTETMPWGMMITQTTPTGGFHQFDLHVHDSIFDANTKGCLQVNNLGKADTAVFEADRVECATQKSVANGGVAGVDVESSDGLVTISGFQIANTANVDIPGLYAHSSSHVSFINNKVLENNLATGSCFVFDGTTQSQAHSNTCYITTSTVGMLKNTSTGNDVGGNIIDGTGTGISFDATSINNFAETEAWGTTLSAKVSDASGSNTWNDGSYLHLNQGLVLNTLGASTLPVCPNGTNNALTTSGCASFTLTTTGTSGAATYSGGVLNIPNYSGGAGGGTAFPGTPINVTGWTWLNQGSTTETTANGALVLNTVGNGAHNVHFFGTTIPAATFTAIGCMMPNQGSTWTDTQTGWGNGLAITDGTKFTFFEVAAESISTSPFPDSIDGANFSNATTRTSGLGTAVQSFGANKWPTYVCFKIHDDGTTRTYSYSADPGGNYKTYATETDSTSNIPSPTKVGWASDYFSNSNTFNGTPLVTFTVTNP